MWGAVAVFAALLLYGIGRLDGRAAASSDAAAADARGVLRAGDAYRARLRAGDQVIAELLREVAGLEVAVDTLRRASQRPPPTSVTTGPVDAVAAGLGLPALPDGGYRADSSQVRQFARWEWRSSVTLPAMERLVAALDSLLAVNRALVTSYAERAVIAEARATAVEASLRALLEVRECRILMFPCPSRTVTFLVGVGLGAVGGFAVAVSGS